jgi:hypothetical protein
MKNRNLSVSDLVRRGADALNQTRRQNPVTHYTP